MSTLIRSSSRILPTMRRDMTHVVRTIQNSSIRTNQLPRRIILIRHGESLGNVDDTSYASIPDWRIPLTRRGERQAAHAGKELQEMIKGEALFTYCRYVNFLVIFILRSSLLIDLPQSLQTNTRNLGYHEAKFRRRQVDRNPTRTKNCGTAIW